MSLLELAIAALIGFIAGVLTISLLVVLLRRRRWHRRYRPHRYLEIL